MKSIDGIQLEGGQIESKVIKGEERPKEWDYKEHDHSKVSLINIIQEEIEEPKQRHSHSHGHGHAHVHQHSQSHMCRHAQERLKNELNKKDEPHDDKKDFMQRFRDELQKQITRGMHHIEDPNIASEQLYLTEEEKKRQEKIMLKYKDMLETPFHSDNIFMELNISNLGNFY